MPLSLSVFDPKGRSLRLKSSAARTKVRAALFSPMIADFRQRIRKQASRAI
jgi:hypothetical protein